MPGKLHLRHYRIFLMGRCYKKENPFCHYCKLCNCHSSLSIHCIYRNTSSTHQWLMNMSRLGSHMQGHLFSIQRKLSNLWHYYRRYCIMYYMLCISRLATETQYCNCIKEYCLYLVSKPGNCLWLSCKFHITNHISGIPWPHHHQSSHPNNRKWKQFFY